MGFAWRKQVATLVAVVFLLLLVMDYRFLPAPLRKFKALPRKIIRHNKNTKSSLEPVLTSDLVTGQERSHPELCPSTGANLRLVILVTSEPWNVKARDAIRKTWGHFTFRSDLALGFVLSDPPDNLTETLFNEDMLHGDIILGQFKDNYSNLTLNTLSMLLWVYNNCNRAPMMLKTSDNVFINVQRLIEFADEILQRKLIRTLWGRTMQDYYPVRNTQSDLFTTQFQYPEIRLNYLTGQTYLLTTDVIKDILYEAVDEPYLGNEDIFITGILATKLEIDRRDEPLFNIKKISRPHICIVKKMISLPKVRYNDMFSLWRQMFNDTVDCDSFKVIWVPRLVKLEEVT